MPWYSGHGFGFPPYVSAGEKRARGALALAKIARQRKRPAEPVTLQHRKRLLATTFWGRAWCENLERYMDLANRLPRGRAYLRNGCVVDLAIGAGTVEAFVAGTELYRVTIRIAPLRRARWRGVVARCTGRIGSLVGLLRGELPPEVLDVLVDTGAGLFPEPREIAMDCSCPDRAGMCKHIAAVLYGVGVRLDTRPELFFTLRQVDQGELLTSGAAGAVARAGAPGRKRITASKLGEVFGIELEEDVAVRATPRRRPRKRRGAT